MADWEIIGLRWVLYLSLALVTGLPIFARLSRSDDLPNASVPQAWIVLVLALCAMCLSVLGFAMQVATMTGSTLFDVDATIVSSLLDQTSLGLALKVRLFAILAAAILAAAALARHSAGWFLQAMAGAVALGTLAWSGHGAATDGPGGWVHLVADIIHLIAAAAWIGALLGFLSMLNAVRRRQDSAASATYRALANFAATGSVLVSVLILTGLTNGWYILKEGSLRDALFAPYAQLLILKLILFAVMLGLASLNRFRLTPALRDALKRREEGSAIENLRRSIILELTAGVVILFLVAWLGTLAPFPSIQ